MDNILFKSNVFTFYSEAALAKFATQYPEVAKKIRHLMLVLSTDPQRSDRHIRTAGNTSPV
jgi:hypothetical protein